MLEKLREYLSSTTLEQQMKDWDAVANSSDTGVSVWDFMASFKHTPAFQRASMVVISETQSMEASFADTISGHQLSMAA